MSKKIIDPPTGHIFNLRDWFAGQALAGMCADTRAEPVALGAKQHARLAYGLADTMLAERDKGQNDE